VINYFFSGVDNLEVDLHPYAVKKIVDPQTWQPVDFDLDAVVLYARSKMEDLGDAPTGLFKETILLARRAGYYILHFRNKDAMNNFNFSTFPLMKINSDLVLLREYCNEEYFTDIPKLKNPQQLADAINITRWFESVTKLASYNRYTLGSDIANAEFWIEQTAQTAAPQAVITNEPFRVGSTNAYNVVVKFTGTERPNEWYIVGAHYDSISQSPSTAAPGAEDNGSGSAGLIELIYGFAKYPPKATVLLVFYSGEEQGCYGSKANVALLNQNGDKSKVRLVTIMDMVGYAASSQLIVLLETYSQYSSTVQEFQNSCRTYGNIGSVVSYNPFGSDHVPYLLGGYNALLNIDYDWDSYPYYHRTTDTPNRLVSSMALGILRGIAGVLGVRAY